MTFVKMRDSSEAMKMGWEDDSLEREAEDLESP
jgi:hypothetical protein